MNNAHKWAFIVVWLITGDGTLAIAAGLFAIAAEITAWREAKLRMPEPKLPGA